MDYTTVIGVDAGHIDQLEMVWPTWIKHKPSLLCHPLVVFVDEYTYDRWMISPVIDHPNLNLMQWPITNHVFSGENTNKWNNSQRHKMLAGFVHVPAHLVKTPYWLKLDLDVVATGNDNWVEPGWFESAPMIVAPGWNYTKPANQMLDLDAWADGKFLTPPLNLHPNPGSDKVVHKRICSWCAFFNTEFTRIISKKCDNIFPEIPVPSQDGFAWYCATRMGGEIRNFNPKALGWKLCSSGNSIRNSVEEVMKSV